MQPILADTMKDMSIYFAVLTVVVIFLAPLVWWYIKKNGKLNEKDKTILIIGTACLAGVFTFPILLRLKNNEANNSHMNKVVANMTRGMEAQKQREKQAVEQLARSMTVNEKGQFVVGKPKPKPTAAELEAQQQRQAEAAIEDAARDRQIEEDRLARELAMKQQREAFDARVAEQKRKREMENAEREKRRAEEKAQRDERTALIESMRDADTFAPPFSTSTTDAQRELDEQIIAGNTEYQALIAERDRIDKIKTDAREEFQAAVRADPRDPQRSKAASQALSESMKLKGPTGLDISRKRSEVVSLILKRFDAEYAKE